MARTSQGKQQEFVYGNWGGMQMCVLRRETAEELAEEGDDFGVGTYREYIQVCRSKPHLYDRQWVDELAEFFQEQEISLDAPPEVSEMPGYGDGWFPSDARTAMLDDLPEEVFEIEEGTVYDEMGGTPMFFIRDDEFPAILRALEGLGYRATEDQELFDRMMSG